MAMSTAIETGTTMDGKTNVITLSIIWKLRTTKRGTAATTSIWETRTSISKDIEADIRTATTTPTTAGLRGLPRSTLVKAFPKLVAIATLQLLRYSPADMRILRMTRDIGMESGAGRKTSEIMVALIPRISRAIEMATMATRAVTATWSRTGEATAKGSCVDIRMATVNGGRV